MVKNIKNHKKQEDSEEIRLRDVLEQCSGFTLEPHPQSFHIATANALAQCSSLVYFSPNTIEKLAHEKMGFTHVEVFDRKNARGVLLANDKEMVIAFRGSHNKEAFLNSALAKPVDKGIRKFLEEMPVHDGAKKYLNAKNGEDDTLWEAIDNARKNYSLTHPEATLYLTGHSIGGSLAMLGAHRLIEQGDGGKIAGLYTFGQPRTGGEQFVAEVDAAMHDRYFRVVNHNDFLATYPWAILTHGGQKVCITPLGDVTVDGQKRQGHIVNFLEQGKTRHVVEKSYLVAAGMIRKPKLMHAINSYLSNMEFVLATERENIPAAMLDKGQWNRVLYGLTSMQAMERGA